MQLLKLHTVCILSSERLDFTWRFIKSLNRLKNYDNEDKMVSIPVGINQDFKV